MAHKIRKVNIDTGTVHYVVRTGILAASNRVDGIDVAPDGTLYAVDFTNDVIYKIYESGRLLGTMAGLLTTAGNAEASGVKSIDGNANGGLNARFSGPSGVCVDASHNIFISDTTNKRIKRVSPSGRVKTLAGDGTTGDAISDTGTSAKFGNALTGICVDKSGILYVADKSNHKIKKIWPSGKVVSLAGGGSAHFHNARGAAAFFSSPSDVAVDNSGNVYVADSGNNCIRKIDTAGNVTILAGGASGAGTSGLVNGAGADARFNNPVRLAIDPGSQFLIVMDKGNGAIRRVELGGRTSSLMPYAVPAGSAIGDLTIDRSGILYICERDS